MALFGIDISNWQEGLDLARVPFDFAIFKATEGTSFVDRAFKGWADWCMAHGKRFGAYVFARDESYASYEAQASYFIAAVRPYLGHCTLWLDWENTSYSSLQHDVSGAMRFLREIERLSGHKPGIYMNQSCAASHDWSRVSAAGYPLWGAGYTTMADRWGYATPSRWWDFGAWGGCSIRQYSSTTYLSGYSGHLDVNCMWESASWWDEMAGGSPAPAPASIAVDGICGPMTTTFWQQQMGSPYVDGSISGQARGNWQRYYPAVDGSVLEFDGGSGDSWLVKAIQRKVGAGVDGVWGRETSTKIQEWLLARKYDLGSAGVDGVVGPTTMRAIQKSLNDKRWGIG